jgi:hypothetical protein
MQVRSTTQPIRIRTSPRRPGLAPLELVLALPLMLCVMALMVNFGNAATWKIRAATSARLDIWRSRPMWGASNDPKPSNWWPNSATMGTSSDNRISQVDLVWNQSDIAQPWIKGPIYAVASGYLVVRDKRVNEMSEGVSKGVANVSLKFPFMPSLGNMTLSADHPLVDHTWQFHSMGYGRNNQRRAKDWWNVEDSQDWAGLKQVFLQADERIRTNPDRELMRPLDRDPDLIAGGYSFDFYPGGGFGGCVNDLQQMQASVMGRGQLPDHITGGNRQAGVNQRMAMSYIRMYTDEMNALLMLPNPPQTRIAQLQQWIDELTQFIATLPQ